MITTVLTIAGALLLAVLVHEAAHGLVLRNHGIPIIRAGIGLPFWPTLTIHTRQRLGFDLTLSPWILGAYVEPDHDCHDRMDAMPYRDQAWWLNAGIIANLILGCTAFAAADLIAWQPIQATIATAAAATIWLARRPIAAYVLPALAIPALAAIGAALAFSWSQGETGVGYAGMGALAPTGLHDTIVFYGVISFTIALMNTIPLFGLDNGKVVGLVLERWTNKKVVAVYRHTGIALVFALLAASVASDLWALVTAVL